MINLFGNYGKKGMRLFYSMVWKVGICIVKFESFLSLLIYKNYRFVFKIVIGYSLGGNVYVIVLFIS